MSYHVFFAFSSGLSAPLKVPVGTRAAIMAHIESVESALPLKRTRYKKNPTHWDHWKRDFSKVPDEVLCETVSAHNQWVRQCYEDLARWSENPVEDGEEITPEDAEKFWFGLEELRVPPQRWTEDYYRERMEVIYEVMRGRPTEGVTFDARKLNPKQAAAVICLFSEFLDTHDIRLDVPNGRDYLASSSDGGYEWCEKCGPVHPDDIGYDGNGCRKRKCPIRAERGEDS